MITDSTYCRLRKPQIFIWWGNILPYARLLSIPKRYATMDPLSSPGIHQQMIHNRPEIIQFINQKMESNNETTAPTATKRTGHEHPNDDFLTTAAKTWLAINGYLTLWEPPNLKGRPKHPCKIHVWAGISQLGPATFLGLMVHNSRKHPATIPGPVYP